MHQHTYSIAASVGLLLAAEGCTSAAHSATPPATESVPERREVACAQWLREFGGTSADLCLPLESLSNSDRDRALRSMEVIAQAMSAPPPTCPSQVDAAFNWQQIVGAWMKERAIELNAATEDLNSLAALGPELTAIAAGSLAAHHEHFVIEVLSTPHPNLLDTPEAIATYRGALNEAMQPWIAGAHAAYGQCVQRASARQLLPWAEFCEAQDAALNERVSKAQSSGRCPDNEPARAVGVTRAAP